MPILSDRLVIRPMTGRDAEALWTSIDSSRGSLREWMPWTDGTTSIDVVHETLQRMERDWATMRDLPVGLFDRESGAHLGGSGLHRIDWKVRHFELGYWLRDDARGRGLATECVAALANFAFDELDARRVSVRMDPRNAASRAIPVRLGFTFEGTLRQDTLCPAGVPRDTDVFSLIRGERPHLAR